MKTRKKMLGSVLTAGVLAVGLSLAGATAAQAQPSGCTTGWATDGKAYGNCSSGTGQYRIGIPCINVFTAFHQYSDWKNVGVPAQVGCPWPSTVWTTIPGGPQILVEKRN